MLTPEMRRAAYVELAPLIKAAYDERIERAGDAKRAGNLNGEIQQMLIVNAILEIQLLLLRWADKTEVGK